MVSLKQFRYFDAVARSGHFGRAAAQCAVSQPALSMQIRDLERELGVVLLERRPDGARLTDHGREIAGRVARVLDEIRDIADLARHGHDLMSGSLRIGVIPTIAPYILPPLLPVLRAQYPQVDLHIRESQTHTIVNELGEGLIDVILVALPVEGPGLTMLDLFEDRFFLALPKDKSFPEPVNASAELLSKGRLLLLEEGHCLRDQALSFCETQRSGKIDTMGASSLSTIVQMVANGMGMTLLPEICLGVEARDAAVALRRFAKPEPSRQIGLAWRASSPREADFVELGRLIKQISKPLATHAF